MHSLVPFSRRIGGMVCRLLFGLHLLLLVSVFLLHLLCLLLMLLLYLLLFRLVCVLLRHPLMVLLLLLLKFLVILVLLSIKFGLLLLIPLVGLGVPRVRRSGARMRLQVLGVGCRRRLRNGVLRARRGRLYLRLFAASSRWFWCAALWMCR